MTHFENIHAEHFYLFDIILSGVRNIAHVYFFLNVLALRQKYFFNLLSSVLIFLRKVKYPPARDVQGDTDVY